MAHVPCGWRPTILHVSVRRYRCQQCAHVWRQDMSQAADPRAKLSRAAVRWALTGLVVHHLTVARVAQALGVSWNTANTAVLAEGARLLINDPARFDGVRVIGVDEHVWRHTTGRRPRQRDPRRSLSSTRPSAPSSRSANPRRGRGSRGANPGSTRRTLGAPDEPWEHPANPGSTRRMRGTPAWFPTNVARNSPPRYSNFEIRPLQFQRFQGISKTDQGKLRATFGGEYVPANAVRPGCLPTSRGPPHPGAAPNPALAPPTIPVRSRLKPRMACA